MLGLKLKIKRADGIVPGRGFQPGMDGSLRTVRYVYYFSELMF